VAERLIYPKGAFILHMIRMMLWDRQTGDQNFRDTMRDFVRTYSGKAATTEDFKAIVEKHMTPEMDMDGNHRMDWFFNEYVYGTALPSYKLDYSFGRDPSGDVALNFKLAQSGVTGSFKMLVPIYLELEDGRIINIGRAQLAGNTVGSQTLRLTGLKEPPKRAVVNYNYDVLADK
jgi:aminopeptidase N